MTVARHIRIAPLVGLLTLCVLACLALYNTPAHATLTPARLIVQNADDEEPPVHAEGWEKVDGVWHYYNADGTMVTDDFVTDPETGARYYLDADGNAVTGSWITHDGNYFYINAKGNPVTNGWAKGGSKYYFLNADGNPVTGDWVKYAGKYYYLTDAGTPVISNWVLYEGNYYFMNSYGAAVINGWAKYGGKYYYLNGYGNPVTGLKTINGEAYIFNSNGSLRTISRNSRLDRIVCRIIRDKTGYSVRAAYDYVAKSFSYIKMDINTSYTGWEEQYALDLYNTGKGNCYGFSALYHFLLKAMGYNNTKVIDGLCVNRYTGVQYRHSWVEVYYNGVTYVCDPVLEGAFNNSYIYSYFITYAQNAAATGWIRYVR